jgi:hypothetical protein
MPAVVLSCTAVALRDVALRQAARDVVAIIARSPQPVVGRKMLRIADAGPDWEAGDEDCEPIGYLELARLLRSASIDQFDEHPSMRRARPKRPGFLATATDAAKQAAASASERRSARADVDAEADAGETAAAGSAVPAGLNRRVVDAPSEKWALTRVPMAPPEGSPRPKAWNPMNPQVRDGLGGRQPRKTPYSPDKVLATLFERYGPALVDKRDRGRRLTVWQVDPTSSGALFMRLSSEELKGGDTLELQLTPGEKVIEEEGLAQPRYVIAATEMKATKDYDTRFDLHWLEERFGRDIKWLVAREPDRISRHESVYRFYESIRRNKVALYYAYWVNGRVNWEEHRFILNVAHAFAVNEGQLIARRMLTPRVERWLLKGKGMPGSQRVGLRRDEENYLVVDEQAWPRVQWLHRRYYDAAQDGRPLTCAQLAEDFNNKYGVSISTQKVHDILTDRIYNDGKWWSTFAGYRVWCRPVELGKRAIPDRIFQRNQEVLRLRKGRNEVTAEGEYLLNVVPFLHAECMHARVGKKRQVPRLRRYNSTTRGVDPYYHFPHPGKLGGPHCKGLSVSEEVEALVVCTVRDLVASRELQEAYAEAVFTDKAQQDDRPTEAELRAARLQVAEMETRLVNMRKNPPGVPGQYHDWTEKAWQELHQAYDDALGEARATVEELEERALLVPPEVQAIDSVLESELTELIQQVLTVYTPENADHRYARAALFKALVSCVILHTTEAGLFVEIQGPFFPDHQRIAGPMSPIQAAKEELRDLQATGMLAIPGAGHDSQTIKQENSCLMVQNSSQPSRDDARLAASDVQAEPPALRGETFMELVMHLRRFEPIPESFKAFVVKTFPEPVTWPPLPHHGPAWLTPLLSLATERRARTEWSQPALLEGLRIAVRELGVDASLTSRAYLELQKGDPRIPPATLVPRKAREWGTTAEALRLQAQADVAAELATVAAAA